MVELERDRRGDRGRGRGLQRRLTWDDPKRAAIAGVKAG